VSETSGRDQDFKIKDGLRRGRRERRELKAQTPRTYTFCFDYGQRESAAEGFEL